MPYDSTWDDWYHSHYDEDGNAYDEGSERSDWYSYLHPKNFYSTYLKPWMRSKRIHDKINKEVHDHLYPHKRKRRMRKLKDWYPRKRKMHRRRKKRYSRNYEGFRPYWTKKHWTNVKPKPKPWYQPWTEYWTPEEAQEYAALAKNPKPAYIPQKEYQPPKVTPTTFGGKGTWNNPHYNTPYWQFNQTPGHPFGSYQTRRNKRH